MRVIVTGASSGIGQHIYNYLRNRGEGVIGISRRGPDIQMDFAKTDQLKSNPIHGEWDLLILNHGLLSFDEGKDWETIYKTNLHSYWFYLDQQAQKGHLIQHGGSIIINASVSGVVGDKDAPYYAAMKAALINMTKSYAKLLLPQDIRVNCFSCGFFKTNLVPGDTPKELIKNIPMKREAEPHEILPVIDMLINCKYITGQNIIVDGGLSL